MNYVALKPAKPAKLIRTTGTPSPSPTMSPGGEVAAAATGLSIFGAMSIVWMLFYLLPTFIGLRKKNVGAIAIVNIFLGWTFVGWIVALAWACTHEDISRRDALIIQNRINSQPRFEPVEPSYQLQEPPPEARKNALSIIE